MGIRSLRFQPGTLPPCHDAFGVYARADLHIMAKPEAAPEEPPEGLKSSLLLGQIAPIMLAQLVRWFMTHPHVQWIEVTLID